MIAGTALAAPLDQFVDGRAHRLDGLIQPLGLAGYIVRDKFLDENAGLVEDDMPQPHAFDDRCAADGERSSADQGRAR